MLFFFLLQDDDEAEQNEQTTPSTRESGTRRSVNLRGQTTRRDVKSQRRRNPGRVHRQSRRERRESGVKIRRRRHVSLVLFRGRVMAGRSAWIFEKRDKRVSEHGGFYRGKRAGRKGVRREKVTEKASTAKVWEENERGASGTSVAHSASIAVSCTRCRRRSRIRIRSTRAHNARHREAGSRSTIRKQGELLVAG